MQRTARLLAPHGAALVALALFLLAGLAVLDDYGVSGDEGIQRVIAEYNLDYVLQADIGALESGRISRSDVFYGIAFEAPVLLAERALGLQDARSVYLSRRLLTHLFFLIGGLFAYLLARRLFSSPVIAVAAMLLFLLSPRLYAHSFFNSKDIPFLVMFMVTLFLAHRAFRRDSLWSFVLLGLGAGLLMNLRIMGVVLFAAIPSMRTLDLLLASGWGERRRALLTSGAFALTGALTVYATMPYLWADPIARSVAWWTTFSNHPTVLWQLFRGDLIITSEAPAGYLPVWFLITNSPAVLLLGGVGAIAICAAMAARHRRLLRNTRLRFLCLIAACLMASVLAVVLLKPNIYSGWRQMYFLHAPFSLLAAFGMQWMASAFRQRRLRAAVYASTGAGAAIGIASMALIHPHQHVYFNFLVDRTTPERLRTQYDMEHWGAAGLDGLRFLLRDRPDGTIAIFAGAIRKNAQLLPESDALRVIQSDDLTGFYMASSLPAWRLGMAVSPSYVPLRYARKIYGNTLYWVATFRIDNESAAPYRELRDRLASSVPAVRSFFNIYVDGDSLVYIKDPCAPMDIRQSLFLHIYPKPGVEDLPSGVRSIGFLNLNFHFRNAGGGFDGQCIAVVPLPDYPIAYVSTGQTKGERLWEERIPIHNDGEFNDRSWIDSIASSVDPTVQSVYDLYLTDDALVYIKEPCVESDIASKFFLHVRPEQTSDLPARRRAVGFDNLDFDFHLRGAVFDGKCVAFVSLPEYPIASIRTGQWVSSEGETWATTVRPSPSMASHR